MPTKPLTAKQDAWIGVWLTNGFNPVEAYQTVYNAQNMQPATVRKETQKVIDAPAIQARLQELREADPNLPIPVVNRPVHTVAISLNHAKPTTKPDKAWLLAEAVDLLTLAKHTGNLAQVRSSLELIGKITGDLVDRKEMRVVRNWADLTDQEIDALAAGELIEAEIVDAEEQSDDE
jgi:hypothetical protein